MSKFCGCGQEILWVKLESGKSNPVDPAFLEFKDNLFLQNVIVVSKSGKVGKLSNLESGYRSHFSTCKDATKFKKKKA